MTLSVGDERIAHDGLGSVAGRVGATDTWHRYDAWGGYRKGSEHWKVPGSAEASLGFTGHSFDADAGLVYAQQRWYSAGLGRFLSEDPVVGNLALPTGLHPWGYANGNPTLNVDPDGRLAFVPALIYAGLVAIIGTEAHVIYQEVAEGAGSSKPIEWDRALKFGGATGATVFSGGYFGVGVAGAGLAFGGTLDVASQTIMDGRQFHEVSWESVVSSAGLSSLMGGGLIAGAKSSVAAVRFATGVTGAGLSLNGIMTGAEHTRQGLETGNQAQVWFGRVESALGLVGGAYSSKLVRTSALQMAGRKVVIRGLGSTFGNVHLEKLTPDELPSGKPSGGAASPKTPETLPSGGTVAEPPPTAKVIPERGENVEVYGNKPVKPSAAFEKWEEFLGPGPHTNNHPRTGLPDPDRIVSADGLRSIRYGSHEIGSSPTKHHYHEEVWTLNPATNKMDVHNTVIRVPLK
ncbi:MAG TPA: RHS repeat-associated core domain-containing protein [Myxococcus sp.]|nr:RHS repeat-associated core domain-containing protein [Myxococcus sp.]